MSRHKRWIDLCVKQAQSNPYAEKYRHAAVLVKGGRPVKIGLNKDKQGYTKDQLYKLKCIHAELDLLCNLPEHIIENGVLYIGGVTKAGQRNISKPCPTCQQYLLKYNLKSIFYSMPDGSFEELVI